MNSPSYPALPCHIAAHAAATPTKVAIIDGERQLDYAALDRLIRQGAGRLADAGISVGSRVMVVSPSKLDLLIAVLAAMGAGASVLPVAANEEDLIGSRLLPSPAGDWNGWNPATIRFGAAF